jgi:hypothetical protein
MINKSGNKSISKETIYNNKPQNTTFNFELNLHTANKFRRIRDCATDSVVDSLFSYDYNLQPQMNQKKSINRNLFLLFIYDYFDLCIKSDFGMYLINNDSELIIDDIEYIKFLFKGGNVYFEIIHRLIHEYNILNTLSNIQRTNMTQFFKDTFAISDFDFTIYIKCTSHDKYLKIKYYLTKFLINKLEDITLFFNMYLSQTLSNVNPYINSTLNGNEKSFSYNGILIQNNILPINPVPGQLLDTQYTQLNVNQINIISRLNMINNLFSEIYNNKFFDKFLNAIKSNIDINYDIGHILGGQFTVDLLDHYSVIVSSFEKYKIRTQIRNIIINIRLINRLLRNNNFNNLMPIQDKYFNSNIINTISKLEYINAKYGPNIFFIYNIPLSQFKNYQLRYFDSLKNYFGQINFYSPEVFGNIINTLVTKLNNSISTQQNPQQLNIFVKDPKESFLFQNRYDYIDDTNFEIVKLKLDHRERFNVNDISINGINDLLYCTNNVDKTLYNNEISNNYHYISYNSSINVNYCNINSHIAFDLLRSKLNFTLNSSYIKKFAPDILRNWKLTKLKIPSEFIDISIVGYEDSFYNHLINDSSYFQKYNLEVPVNPFTNNKFVVESFNTSYFIYDLVIILFGQNHITTPWLDIKYAKRLRRLFFIYAINNYARNTMYLQLIRNIASNMVLYITTRNQIHLQFINIHSKYNFDTNDFLFIMNDIMDTHQNLHSQRFAIDILYFNQLDELINTMFFVFNIFYFYSRGPNITIQNIRDDVLTYNIINYLRNKFMFYNFTDVNGDFNTYYISKIRGFLVDIVNETDSVIRNINLIWTNLPPSI